jgi:N-acetylmuramoyl-L-alanine amidase
VRIDGIVGTLTWERLVEAGRLLGDRVLSTTAPLLRGDDVAELQERLAALGFDPGRVDGIYGAMTRAAVASFQRDAGVGGDGVVGPATLAELRRLAVRHPRSTLVSEVRERSTIEHGRAAHASLSVVLAHAGGLDTLAAATARQVRAKGATASVVVHADEAPLVAAVNEKGAGALVVLRLDPGAAAATALYFRSERSESPSGRRLAELLAAGAAKALATRTETRGMTLPVLRETRMPAAILEVGPLDRVVERTAQLADAVSDALDAWSAPLPATT